MPVTIKTKAASEPVKDLPRKGIHLRATPWERLTAHGYKGNASGPLCNTGDGHYTGTHLTRGVTCPCCIAYIADLLRLPEYLTVQQWAIIGRDPLPGAPDTDKGECYPDPLPKRNAYGRAGTQVVTPKPTRAPQEAPSEPQRSQAPKTRGATQKPAPSIYDDF